MRTLRANLMSSPRLSRNIIVRIYETIILPVVLHGCETWSLILKEEHRLRVIENTVLRRIFGPKMENGRNCITRNFIICTPCHIKKNSMAFSPQANYTDLAIYNFNNQVNEIRRAGHEGQKRNAHQIFVENPEEKRPLGRHRRKWEDNIKMYLRELGWCVTDCINLAREGDQWRTFVNIITNIRVP
jgi:hypothetical protein